MSNRETSSASPRSVLITGCSSGIGYHAAHTLSARGWRVFATCRSDEDCARLSHEGLESLRLDYADTPSIHETMDILLSRTGGTLDAVFNNGAYAIPGATEDLPTAALRAIFETNVFGWHELTRAVLPVMRAQGSGRIVQNSSVLGLAALRWRGAYVATKFAIEGLSDVLRLEMHGTGIHICLIEPGPITSRIRENSIPHFETWIDWENSPRAAQYRDQLLARLYDKQAPDIFELPPDAVTRRLIHALEARRPKPRYRVTTPTHILATARRVLPTTALDWILRKL